MWRLLKFCSKVSMCAHGHLSSFLQGPRLGMLGRNNCSVGPNLRCKFHLSSCSARKATLRRPIPHRGEHPQKDLVLTCFINASLSQRREDTSFRKNWVLLQVCLMTGFWEASVIAVLQRVAILKEFLKCPFPLWPRGHLQWRVRRVPQNTEKHFSVRRKQGFQSLSCHFIQRRPWRPLCGAPCCTDSSPEFRQFWNVLPLLLALWTWGSYLVALILIFLIKQKSCAAYPTDCCEAQIVVRQYCESNLAWCLPHTVNTTFSFDRKVQVKLFKNWEEGEIISV